VQYVPINGAEDNPVSSNGKNIERLEDTDDTDYYGHEKKGPRNHAVELRPPSPAMPTEKVPPQVMCYICRLHKRYVVRPFDGYDAGLTNQTSLVRFPSPLSFS